MILAAMTGPLLRSPTLAMLALRRVGRRASHPALFARISHSSPDEYQVVEAPTFERHSHLCNSGGRWNFADISLGCQLNSALWYVFKLGLSQLRYEVRSIQLEWLIVPVQN
jgi:hypothetical protein